MTSVMRCLSRIEESINSGKPLIFIYTKWNEYIPEERRVIFQEMYSKNDRFYAVGYCLKRRDKRTFRLDRIQKIIKVDYSAEALSSAVLNPELPAGSITIPRKIEEIKKELKVHRAEVRSGVLIAFLVIAIGGGILFMFVVVNTPGMWDKVFGEKDDYYAKPTSISYSEIKGTDRYFVQSDLIDLDKQYRGYFIEEKGSGYEVKGLPDEFDSLFNAVVKVNSMVFTRVTGIRDEKLLKIYTGADANKNGILSWEEIKSFQLKINREFKYISNDVALRPDDFMKEGGGDCEDWALFTAGLLRFWNYEPYIGSLNFKDNYHAVTLVKVDELPYKFKGYNIKSAKLTGEKEFPEGYYTFIDYYRVGRLTRVAGRKPRLIKVSESEWCYGRSM